MAAATLRWAVPSPRHAPHSRVFSAEQKTDQEGTGNEQQQGQEPTGTDQADDVGNIQPQTCHQHDQQGDAGELIHHTRPMLGILRRVGPVDQTQYDGNKHGHDQGLGDIPGIHFYSRAAGGEERGEHREW